MNAPVRFSHLRAYGRSPAHGRHARLNDSSGETTAMQRGTAVHALLLGNKQVTYYPGAQRRGKEWEAFAAEHADKVILTATEFAKAKAMADAILATPLARPYLDGIVEETLNFRWMGLDCRATPDVRGATFLTEIKTSATVEPVRFTYHALRMAYHAQMRMQQIACGDTDCRCIVIGVESEAPYPVTVFEIDPRTLELGEKLLVLWAERLKQCEEAGYFPGYTQTIYPISAPEEFADLEFAEES